MTVLKVLLIPPVKKLKDLKIYLNEIIIIEEQINGVGKAKKENNRFKVTKIEHMKQEVVFLLMIIIYKIIRMTMKRSLRSSRLWIQISKNKMMIYLHNSKTSQLVSQNQYQVKKINNNKLPKKFKLSNQKLMNKKK
jgi:hypothetical protein